jgi:hypothetical protein
VEIELLYWSGCPSHPAALADLRAALQEVGAGSAEVTVRAVETDAAATAEDFPGSPTIRVGGQDLFPSPEPPSLTCRIYLRRSGQPSPTPDPDDLRDALRRALQEDA